LVGLESPGQLDTKGTPGIPDMSVKDTPDMSAKDTPDMSAKDTPDMSAKGKPDSWDMTGNRDRLGTVVSKQRDWRTPEKFFLQMCWNRLYKLNMMSIKFI
jgi:hypothetical protein